MTRGFCLAEIKKKMLIHLLNVFLSENKFRIIVLTNARTYAMEVFLSSHLSNTTTVSLVFVSIVMLVINFSKDFDLTNSKYIHAIYVLFAGVSSFNFSPKYIY